MKETYKTKKPIDFSKTVVISFDVNSASPNLYKISLQNSAGKIIFNGYDQITYPKNVFYNNKSETIFFSVNSVNFIDGIKVFYYKDNDFKSYPNIDFEWDSSKKEIFYKQQDEEDENIINLVEIDDGTRIYEKTDNYQNKENLIVEENIVYELSNQYKSIPYIIEPFKVKNGKNEENAILILENKGDDLTFLSIDNVAERNVTKNPVYEINQKIIDEKGETKSNSVLSNGHLFDNNNRLRLVYNNNGKTLNVSLFDNDTKTFKNVSNFSFINEIEKDYMTIQFENCSVSNVSTNF